MSQPPEIGHKPGENNETIPDPGSKYPSASECTRNLDLIHSISSELVGTGTIREVVEKLVNLIADSLNYTNCAVLVYHNELEELEVMAAYGYGDVEGLRIPTTRGVSGYVARTGEATIIPDVTEDPRYMNGIRGGQSEIAIPITYAGEIMGVLDAESSEKDAFGPADLALFEVVAGAAAIAMHAAGLSEALEAEEKEKEQIIRRMKVLAAANRSVGEIEDLGNLLAKILNLIREVLKLDKCAVLIHDAQTDELVLNQQLGHGDVSLTRFPAGHGVVGEAFKKGRPILITDVKKDPRYIEGSPGGRSEMAVPLKVKDKIIGVLDAESTQDPFTDDDLDLFTLFAVHASHALNAAQLKNRLQEQNEILDRRAARLSILNQAAMMLTSTLDLDEVLSSILEMARKALDLSHCAVLLLEEDSEELEVRAQAGYDVGALLRIPMGQGITGNAAQTGESIVVGDVNEDSRYVKGVKNAKSEMAVPLKVYGEVIGVIDAESDEPDAFRERDLELFQNFAAHAAVAIHNASMFANLEKANRTLSLSVSEMERINNNLEERTLEISSTNEELEKRVSQLMTLHEAGLALTSTLDLDQVLDAILMMTHRIVESSTSAIKLIDDETKELKVRVQTGRGSDEKENKAALKTPLVIGNRTIGMFEMQRPDNAYSEEERRILETMAAQAAIAVENARLFDKTQRIYYQTLKALAQALETRDISTRGHCERVAKYATALARRMGFDANGIEEIHNAALLHDIGKIGIRDDILLKTQKLTPDEEAEIRSHPVYGDKILSSLKFLGKVAETVKYHHERWDGSGYPSGLKGAQIPLASRILAVCDAFDTITSDRPYRPARTPEEAIEELKSASGQQFDPEVVEKLLSMLGMD